MYPSLKVKVKVKKLYLCTVYSLKLEACGAVWEKMNVGFWGEGKTGVPGEKPLRAGKRTNKFSPHETPDLRIEPGSHWWEASALTTTPSLLPSSPPPPPPHSQVSQPHQFPQPRRYS